MRIETKQNEGKTSIKRELEDQIERAKVTSAKCDSKYSTDMEIIKVSKRSGGGGGGGEEGQQSPY